MNSPAKQFDPSMITDLCKKQYVFSTLDGMVMGFGIEIIRAKDRQGADSRFHLPQVAEANTPRPMDVAGEYLL
jgi:hypothetical protein